MTGNSLGGYYNLEFGILTGACPVCGLQFHGAQHVCPGPLHSDPQKELLGAQHVDEPSVRNYRPYGERLAKGFAMMHAGE